MQPHSTNNMKAVIEAPRTTANATGPKITVGATTTVKISRPIMAVTLAAFISRYVISNFLSDFESISIDQRLEHDDP